MPSSRRSFLTGVAAGGIALAGCAGLTTGTTAYRSYGYGAHNLGSAAATAPDGAVDVAWRAENAIVGQVPAVVDGRVFVAVESADGPAVRTLDATTGEQQWTYADVGPLGSWQPAVAGEGLYFLDRDGVAHAVDITDGTRRWRRTLPDEQGPAMSPVVVDDALVVGLGDLTTFQYGGLYALELADGTTRWHREPAPQVGAETPAYPAADGDSVYYAAYRLEGEAGAVTAVDAADGDAKRGLTVGSGTDGEVTTYSGVAVTDDRVYTGGTRGIAAIERPDWTLAWRSSEGGTFLPPTVADGRTYAVSQADGPGRLGVVALDEQGERRWSHAADRDDDATVGAGPPTVVGETLYYGARDGRLYALDVETGERRWRAGASSTRPFGPPAVVDGRIYAVSERGLVALRAA